MTEELKPIDVSKYTVTESGNVIRTDNKETLKNALERITELEKENEKLKGQMSLHEGLLWNDLHKLEKENAELKEQNKNLQVMLQAEREVRVNEDYLKKITDLEAENEELKEKLKPENCLKLLAKEGYINFTSEPLTKAKKLLKWALHSDPEHDEDFEKRWEEAEQFIKDLEK